MLLSLLFAIDDVTAPLKQFPEWTLFTYLLRIFSHFDLEFRIVIFNSILFRIFFRIQNAKNSEMCKWNGRTNIKHQKICTNNTFDWYEWNILYPLVFEWIRIRIQIQSTSKSTYIFSAQFLSQPCHIEKNR